MSNDLVVTKESLPKDPNETPDSIKGIGIAESVHDVASLNDGSSWVEAGLAYGGLAMEAVSVAVDPIGTLLSYGLSWLIEHVEPLQEALDWFAGDPDGVKAYGATWENVSKAVQQAATEYNEAVKADTAQWVGPAGDAYRRYAAEKGEALNGAAELAGTISSVVTIMGEVVSFVRDFVRDLVADCVSRLITYALEAVCTLGLGTPVIAAQATSFISKTVARISEVVQKLLKTINNVSPKLGKMVEVFGDIIQALGKAGKKVMDAPGKLADNFAEAAWKKVDDTFGTNVVGRHKAKFGDGGGGPDGGSDTTDSPDSSSKRPDREGRSDNTADTDSPSTDRRDSTSRTSDADSPSTSRTTSSRDSADPADPRSASPGRPPSDSGPSSRPDSPSGEPTSSSGGPGTSSRPSSHVDTSSSSSGGHSSDSSPSSRAPASSEAGSSPSGGRTTTMSGDLSSPPPTGQQSSASPDTGSPSGGGPSSASAPSSGGGPSAGAGPSRVETSDPATTSSSAAQPPQAPEAPQAPQTPTPSAPRADQPAGTATPMASPTATPTSAGGPTPGGGAPNRPGAGGGWTGTPGSPGAAGRPSSTPEVPRPRGADGSRPDTGRPHSPERPQGSRPDTSRPNAPERPQGSRPEAGRPQSPERPRGSQPDANRPHAPERPHGSQPDASRPHSPERPQGSRPDAPERPRGSHLDANRPHTPERPHGSRPDASPQRSSSTGPQSASQPHSPTTPGARPDAGTNAPTVPPQRQPGGPDSRDPGMPGQQPPASRGDAPAPGSTRPDAARPGASGDKPASGQRPGPEPRDAGPGRRPDAADQKAPDQRSGTDPKADAPRDSAKGDAPRDADAPDKPKGDGRPHDADADQPRPGTPEYEQKIDHAVDHLRNNRTDAGASGHTDPNLQDLARRVPDDGKHFTVDAHMRPDGRIELGGRSYSPDEFADVLRRLPECNGKPIRLISCNSGDFAADLARKLDVPVTAPRGLAWTDGNGRVFSSSQGPDGKPGWPPDGGWDTHHPNGTKSPASDDGFHPSRHGEDPGERPDDVEMRGEPFDAPPERRVVEIIVHKEDFPDDDFPDPDVYGSTAGNRHQAFPDPVTDWTRPDDATFERPEGHEEGKSPIKIPDPSNPEPFTALDSKTSLSSLSNAGLLQPNTRYDIEGRGSFFTDESGKLKWAEVDTTAPGYVRPNIELQEPAPNAQYRVDDNWTFNTNEHGQTERMSGSPHFKGSPNALPSDRYYRDPSSQTKAADEGREVYPNRHWAGGHMAAHEMGGPGEYINMFPQMAASNSGHNREGMTVEASWRSLERYLAEHAKTPGCSVDRVEVVAERDRDGIPTEVLYRWIETKDGVSKVVEAWFPNRPDFNYGEWKSYKK